MMELLKESAVGKRNIRFIVASGNSRELTDLYVEKVRETFNPGELIATSISPVIGTHVGPDTAGVAFIGD
jgi:fatty acid-binding protein DegV